MSKILNRPMFRGGGKVSSYGNGITTGLADGGMASKRGLVDGPGGYGGLKDINKFNNYEEFQDYNKFINANEKILSNQEIDTQVEEGKFANRPWYDLTGILDLGMGIAGPSSDFIQKLQYEKTDPGEQEYRTELETNRDNLIRQSQKYGVNIPEGISLTKPEVVKEQKTEAEIRAEIAKEYRNQFNSEKPDSKEEAVAAIKKRQELMEEVMGGGKSARIADASDMALSFASKALGEGATVKSAFADFLGDETKRPSRSQKVKDAAANAAIQSYLTEQLSEKDFNKQMRMIMGKQEILNKSNDPKNKSWNDRRNFYAASLRIDNRDKNAVLKPALQDEPGNNQVIFTEKTDFIKDPIIASEMEDGFYVVTTKNGKRVFQIIEGIVTDRSSDFPI